MPWQNAIIQMSVRESLKRNLLPQVANGTHASSANYIPNGIDRCIGTRALLGRGVNVRPYEANGGFNAVGMKPHQSSTELDGLRPHDTHDIYTEEEESQWLQKTAIAGEGANRRTNVRWWNHTR